MSRIDNALALDLGTVCGYAYCDGDVTTSGVWDFSTKRHEGGGMRYLRFRRELSALLDRMGGLEAVYWEEVRHHKGVIAGHVYGGLQAILMSLCEERNIPYQSVPVGQIKQHATGKGNASKAMMMDAAAARGWEFSGHDEADALWILDWAQSQ